MAQKIIDRENNIFQHVLVLRDNRKARSKYGEFFVEGVRCIDSMMAHRWEATAFYFDGRRSLSEWAVRVLDASRSARHYPLSPQLMKKLSQKEETSELVATARIPEDDFDRIPVHGRLLAVVLDRPSSPGNLGTSIRSCDAFGADAVIITGHAADPYHPQAVRGSMGSIFAQRVLHSHSHAQLGDWISSARSTLPALQIIGTSSHAEVTIGDLDRSRPTIFCVGNETTGLAPQLAEICCCTASIPQRGWASSLNVSCALSIFLYEFRSKGEG